MDGDGEWKDTIVIQLRLILKWWFNLISFLLCFLEAQRTAVPTEKREGSQWDDGEKRKLKVTYTHPQHTEWILLDEVHPSNGLQGQNNGFEECIYLLLYRRTTDDVQQLGDSTLVGGIGYVYSFNIPEMSTAEVNKIKGYTPCALGCCRVQFHCGHPTLSYEFARITGTETNLYLYPLRSSDGHPSSWGRSLGSRVKESNEVDEFKIVLTSIEFNRRTDLFRNFSCPTAVPWRSGRILL